MKPLYVIGGGVGLAGLAYLLFRNKSDIGDALVNAEGAIVAAVTSVFDSTGRLAFTAILPARSVPYADELLNVAQDLDLNPFTLWALLERESQSGTASSMKPKTAAGTGDWTGRVGHWRDQPGPGTKVVNVLPYGWNRPRDRSGQVIPGPYAIPSDELGWGRGLMQIDFADPWIQAGNDWRDASANIRRGGEVLLEKMKQLKSTTPITIRGVKIGGDGQLDPRPLEGDVFVRTAIAAYNTGWNALKSLVLYGNPDATTTAGKSGAPDYSSDVVARALALTEKFNTMVTGEAPALDPSIQALRLDLDLIDMPIDAVADNSKSDTEEADPA